MPKSEATADAAQAASLVTRFVAAGRAWPTDTLRQALIASSTSRWRRLVSPLDELLLQGQVRVSLSLELVLLLVGKGGQCTSFCHTSAMATFSKRSSTKPKLVTGQLGRVATRFKAGKSLVRGGNSLRVAPAVAGDDAVDILRAAGILTVKGKLSPSYS